MGFIYLLPLVNLHISVKLLMLNFKVVIPSTIKN